VFYPSRTSGIISTSTLAVLGNTPRAFKDVLERAQGILRTTFGMELVELQSRAELDKEDTSKDNADGDRRKATGVKKKGQHNPAISHLSPPQIYAMVQSPPVGARVTSCARYWTRSFLITLPSQIKIFTNRRSRTCPRGLMMRPWSRMGASYPGAIPTSSVHWVFYMSSSHSYSSAGESSPTVRMLPVPSDPHSRSPFR